LASELDFTGKTPLLLNVDKDAGLGWTCGRSPQGVMARAFDGILPLSRAGLRFVIET
jgi:hypothetical protein